MIKLLLFETVNGRRPFQRWFDALEKNSAKRVTLSLLQMRAGNLSDSRTVGGAVFERRIQAGPGYRLYCGKEGNAAVVLLAGGSKKSQGADIIKARRYWKEYKSSQGEN